MKLNTCRLTIAESGFHTVIRCWLLAAILPTCCGTAAGQSRFEYHQPLNQHLPTGQAAAWLNAIRGYDPAWLQPVRIELPAGGLVAIHSASADPFSTLPSPAQFAVNAGHHYRLKLSELPEFPGEELFPSIEILDHLHPPAGQEHDFPIPIVFTKDDIRLALAGKLVTRVIYLEQPSMAAALDPLRREIPQAVSPADNALQEADRLGRPMIIVRIGGRIPSGPDMPLSFFGSGGAVSLSAPAAPAGDVVQMSDPRRRATTVAGR